MNKFWKGYKNKSQIENKAIESIEKALSFLFDNIPKEKIISVYIKGTFVTREMNRNSDVDIVPILKDIKTLKELQELRDKNKELLKPAELLPISLTELKQNKNASHRGKNKGQPDTFLLDLDFHKLVYGKKLNKNNFPSRTEREILNQYIKTLKTKSIKLHKERKFGLQQLIKQVFWICYYEQRLAGKNPPRTWKGLNKFIKDKENIIHKTYFLRMHPTKDKHKRKVYIKFLENYFESK